MRFLTLAIALLAVPVSAAAEKPNVLFIAIDDLRTTLGCYGHDTVKSPNIDRLAKDGVMFERAYCQFPLCNPSRASLLTGRYPTETGILDNSGSVARTLPEAVTLPRHFKDRGYPTLTAGKIFHGGLDVADAWTVGGQPNPGKRPPRTAQIQEEYRKRSDRWVAVKGVGEKLNDYRIASRAIELLEEHKDEPFFLAVGFQKPHTPLIAPKKYFDLYDAEAGKLPSDFAPRVTLPEGAPAKSLPPNNGDLFIGRDATEAEARQMIRAYYACASFIDAEIGRVLAKLDELKLTDQTIIVLWSDHGFHLGEKGKWSKHNSLYEPAARVPMIIVAPGRNGNGKPCPHPVELVDLYPTLCELCDLPKPEGLQGHSLVPLLDDPDTEWDRPAYTMTRSGKTVRTDRWRYEEWGPNGRDGSAMYDLKNDPGETKNLVDDPKHAERVAKLRRLLRGDWAEGKY